MKTITHYTSEVNLSEGYSLEDIDKFNEDTIRKQMFLDKIIDSDKVVLESIKVIYDIAVSSVESNEFKANEDSFELN